MPALFTQSTKPFLWLDYTDYAGALLAGGAPPWLDVTACVAWQRKAQGLLKSDVVTLPLANVAAAWLAAHTDLRDKMASKTRAVFPLKTLLADEALRAHLVELAAGLRGSFGSSPLALVCPSPKAWLTKAYAQAFGDQAAPQIGDDEIDSAAVYLADALRAFAEIGIDTLLLTETATSEPADSAGIALYKPVLNIAAHYRWELGLLVPAGRYTGGDAGLNFVIAPGASSGARYGKLLDDAFWSGAAPPADAAFYYAAIPAAAQPEHVLQRLGTL